ncbi:hypothetical protein B296_00008636 [Ensete ventricosum]|uniref:Uncharacterized protein n=1 Tax=Ensete ventricosum TaxID=4639 RepID=A0A427A8F0_ENSVE|nr:hypothetical protein B296_00008636 [Ensete ventricosum]
MVHGVGPRKETRPNVLSSSSGPAPTAGAHLVVSRAKRRLLGFATFLPHLLLYLWSFARPLQLDLTRRCAVMRGRERRIRCLHRPIPRRRMTTVRRPADRLSISSGESSNAWGPLQLAPISQCSPNNGTFIPPNDGIRHPSSAQDSLPTRPMAGH